MQVGSRYVCMYGDVWKHGSMDVCMYEHGCRDRKDLVAVWMHESMYVWMYVGRPSIFGETSIHTILHTYICTWQRNIPAFLLPSCFRA